MVWPPRVGSRGSTIMISAVGACPTLKDICLVSLLREEPQERKGKKG
jgi:hypothetical protein